MEAIRNMLRRIDVRALPISVKITFGMLVALIVGGVITDSLISQVLRQSQSDQAQRDLQATSETQALRTVDLLNTEIAALDRLGANAQVQQELLTLQSTGPAPSAGAGELYHPDTVLTRQVLDFENQLSEFDTVIILDAKGNILAAIPPTPEIELATQSAWPWFLSATNNGVGSTFVSGPMDDGLTSVRGIHIAVPIYQVENGVSFSGSVPQARQVIGVLYGIWNLRNAQTLLSSGAGREGVIISGDGTVLMSHTQTLGDQLDPVLLAAIKANPQTQQFAYTDRSGRQLLAGVSSIADLAENDPSIFRPNWVIITSEPSSILDASVAALQSRLRVLLAIVAMAAGVVVLLSSRALFAPLRHLTRVAHDIEQGALDRPIPQFPHDEIGRLASVLDQVVSQLLRRVRQLRSAVQISRVTVVGHSIDQMLEDVARSIGQQFEYPDVRIFIIDASGQRIRLDAAFGAESERLQKMGYRLALDEETLVGRAILLNEPLLGGGKEALRHAGLITEHSELAVPLSASGGVQGAIHILAGRLRELDREDVEVMTLVADQLSTAIQNARLLEQSRAQVAEIEALNRRLTRQAWEEYVGDSGALRHTLDPADQWPATLSEVRRHNEIKAETYTDGDGRSVLAAPLILRGEAMGSLAVTRPAGEKWSRDEVMLLESIASRMAMIAEGIRLVEESSRRAERELRVNEISANMLQRASSVETVLRSALSELGGALGSDRIALRIGAVPARSDHQISAGDLPDESAPHVVAPAAPPGDSGSNGDGGPANGD